jgi:cohesin loading factor subunit SCC2
LDISKLNTNQTSNTNHQTTQDTIKANKFYSKTTENNNNKTSKSTTAKLDTKSALHLPDDFTPELIAQLASEGYDISGMGSGRKAAARAANRTTAIVAQTLHNVKGKDRKRNFEDLSDSSGSGAENNDNYSDDDDHHHHHSKKTFKTTSGGATPSKILKRSMNNEQRFSTSRNLVKHDIQDPTEHPSYKRFTQILDEILDSYEQDLEQNRMSKKLRQQENNDDEDEEIPPEYLLSKQICAEMAQEAFKLNSYSIMDSIRKESLMKLQNLLYFNVKDGFRALHLMNNEDFYENDKVFREILTEKLFRALDCSIIALIIMTSPKIPKELIVEDLIEQIVAFTKLNLNQVIYPFYDPVYKPASNTSSDSKSNLKRKLLNQFTNSASSSSASKLSSSSSTSKNMHYFANKTREILSLLSDLVYQTDMTDTIVIIMSTMSVMCFFVENINDLQLECLKIITCLFTRYPKHRQLVLDDIFSSLIKLHNMSKRSLKGYKCFNGDSIQMFTALVLQLIQSECATIDFFTHNSSIENTHLVEATFEEKETHLIQSYESSSKTAKKFLSLFFAKCKTKQQDFDFRPLFENFIQDLLTTVNKPEWPVSESILNMLGLILVNQIQNSDSDVSSRVNSLEYLGQIVSQLRKDSLEYQKFPERIAQLLDKLEIKLENQIDENEDNKKELSVLLSIDNLSHKDLFVLQKNLVKYLDSLVANDTSLKYAKMFLVAQWLIELNQKEEETKKAASKD